MIKKWLFEKGLQILFGAIALGIGVWYLSSSIGGASLSYISVDNFLSQIGVQDGDITTANGCFLCQYIGDLFGVLGRATQLFWTGIVGHLWILMAIGFGIFIAMHTLQYIRENAASKDVKDLTDAQPKLNFSKWFDRVWKTGVRVMIAGAFLGAVNWAGTGALRTVTNLTVAPVMYIGSELSMAATNLISNTQCKMPPVAQNDDDILNPVLGSFMCVISNLNVVMLAGAGGGFALMNYSWMDLNEHVGGIFTWIAGLLLVIGFLFIGFDLVFQILTVIFKLIFIIIFMPIMIAAAAFEQVWSLAKNITNRAIDMLIHSAISIIKISLKITIIFAVVFFAADKYFPGPADGFTTILPPLITQIAPQNMDARTMSVMNVFSKCESVALQNGEMDRDRFVSCFKAQKNVIESQYPGAFDFMDDGLDFLIFMIGVFLLYFWVVSPKIDNLMPDKDPNQGTFDYGQWLKDFGTTLYNLPRNTIMKIKDKLK